MATPLHARAARLRRFGVLTTVLAAAVVTFAVNAAPARATDAGKGSGAVHTIRPEVSPGGLAAPSITTRAGQPPAASADALRRLCSGHAVEYGNWVNADPNANGLARIELRDCEAVTTCHGDVCSVTYDAGWRMRVFGRCSPTNCDWGWSAGQFRLGSGHIYGYYDQGFAKRRVYAKMSAYRPGQLWVFWRTDFVDPNRADYERQEWFVRA